MNAEEKTILDVTGVALKPGDPDMCEGNGLHEGNECCCDECDFFLLCFPEYDREQKMNESRFPCLASKFATVAKSHKTVY